MKFLPIINSIRCIEVVLTTAAAHINKINFASEEFAIFGDG
jgi:hypothetical protein